MDDFFIWSTFSVPLSEPFLVSFRFDVLIKTTVIKSKWFRFNSCWMKSVERILTCTKLVCNDIMHLLQGASEVSDTFEKIIKKWWDVIGTRVFFQAALKYLKVFIIHTVFNKSPFFVLQHKSGLAYLPLILKHICGFISNCWCLSTLHLSQTSAQSPEIVVIDKLSKKDLKKRKFRRASWSILETPLFNPWILQFFIKEVSLCSAIIWRLYTAER